MASARDLDSTGQLMVVIAERLQPSSSKPAVKLAKAEDQKALDELDRRNAQCYADMEIKSHRLRKMAQRIAAMDDSADDDIDEIGRMTDQIARLGRAASLRDDG